MLVGILEYTKHVSVMSSHSLSTWIWVHGCFFIMGLNSYHPDQLPLEREHAQLPIIAHACLKVFPHLFSKVPLKNAWQLHPAFNKSKKKNILEKLEKLFNTLKIVCEFI